jgi:hypothetical protein
MNDQKKALYAQFHQNATWLDDVFNTTMAATFPFNTPTQHVIFEALVANWQDDFIATLNELQQQYGAEVAAVLELVLGTNTRTGWAEIGRQQASRTITDFYRLLWEPLPALGFEFTSTSTVADLQMHCTQCPWVALGEALEGRNWLYHLICGGDPHMVAGFNPQIGFRRTKTLMQGDNCCDHYYFMKTA